MERRAEEEHRVIPRDVLMPKGSSATARPGPRLGVAVLTEPGCGSYLYGSPSGDRPP